MTDDIMLLKCGNTNTFLINRPLVDTDYAGTLGAFATSTQKWF